MATLKAMAENDFTGKTLGITEMLKSNDQSIQVAGLDLALSPTLSKALPQNQREDARFILAAYALPLLKSSDVDIRGRTIRLLASAPKSVIAKAIVPMLTNPDANCQRYAGEALSRLAWELKIEDPLIVDLLRPSPSNATRSIESYDLPAIQTRLLEVWETKKDKVVTAEASRLTKALQTGTPVERESAGIYLDYLGIAR